MTLGFGLHQDVILKGHTTWHVGGSADAYFIPSNVEHIVEFLKSNPLPAKTSPIWLGLGSNVLVSDEGVRDLVIASRFGLREIKLTPEGFIRAEAGVTCAKFARFCIEQGYPQGAFFAGIPGTIGGALAMNAGAFGWQTWERVRSLEVIEPTIEVLTRQPSDFDVGYRHVVGEHHLGFIAAVFDFSGLPAVIDRQQPLLSISELLKKRNASQPIGTFNCGSVFKNPDNGFAGKLIAELGLQGHRIGGAHVSVKHANFIINDDNASSSDILALMNYIQNAVYHAKNVYLEREVRLLGQFKEICE